MRRLKQLLSYLSMILLLSCLFCLPVLAAVSESDVQAQVETAGKEAVSGNVLIWFLCAIAFLKVSQKIDSFMASLGINVGRTGGSMLAEAMIAARGIGGLRNFSSHYFGGGKSSATVHAGQTGSSQSSFGSAGGFAAGGLAGIVNRSITHGAVKSATASGSSGASGGLGGLVSSAAGGQIYSASVEKGGDFANGVIGTVATGSISSHGSMTGEKAAEALHSYLGYAALEEGAQHVPSFQNVEIGGGRITGTEVSEEYPEGISFGMYHAAQYTPPTGAYTTVQAADGTSWYRQYAADTVEKSPYMAPDGSIAYKESIVKKLPPPPKRKDRI